MRLPLLVFALMALLSAGCKGTFGTAPPHRPDPGDPGGPSVTPTPACPVDPDCAIGGDCSVYECPEYWICETHPSGAGKRCTNPGPDYPDGGDWECEDVDGRTVCRGDHYPDGGGDGLWDCETQAEFVVCTKDEPDYPDGHGDGPWNCWFEAEIRICENTPEDGGGWTCWDGPTGRECRQRNPDYPDDRDWSCYDLDGETVCTAPGDLPDGGTDTHWDCFLDGELVTCRRDEPDYPDEGGDTPWDCVFSDEFRVCREGGPDVPDGGDDECVPGTERWCDDAVYCSWGKQTCLPSNRWGPCIEPEVGSSGLGDRPDTACGCRYFYFNERCCEDQEDRNRDGHPDCIIPRDHRPPTCASDGSLCSFCDRHEDCGGDGDMCIFTRDGATMCSRDCLLSGCPDGYTCSPIVSSEGIHLQCTPDSGSCE